LLSGYSWQIQVREENDMAAVKAISPKDPFGEIRNEELGIKR